MLQGTIKNKKIQKEDKGFAVTATIVLHGKTYPIYVWSMGTRQDAEEEFETTLREKLYELQSSDLS